MKEERTVQGKTAGISGHLGVSAETQFNGNFLESLRMMLMKNPRNGGYGVCTGHTL